MRELQNTILQERCFLETLPNGLTVYVIPKPGYHKTAALLASRFGGNDTRFVTGSRVRNVPVGTAHFLKHCLFETPKGSVLPQFTVDGASVDAFTTRDMTGFYLACTEHVEQHLTALLHFVMHPVFTEESVRKEQDIIAREIQMKQDLPDRQAHRSLMQEAYQCHAVRNSVLGDECSISCITPERLELCHTCFYHPSNLVLCVAGDVDPNMVMRAAATVPSWDVSGVQRDYGEEEPETVAMQETECRMDVSSTVFALGFKAEAAVGLREQLLGELAAALLVGPSSPLYLKLYRQGIINQTFRSRYCSGTGYAYFEFSGESETPAVIAEEILGEAIRIAWTGTDPGLFERMKKASYGMRVKAFNSMKQICTQIAAAHFNGGFYFDFPALYHQISVHDVKERIQDSITGERCTLSIVRPQRSVKEL